MDCAVANLLGRGLVARGRAADDGGDPGVAQAKTVVAGDGAGFAGKSERVEHGVHEVAGAISGEGTAGAVGTVGAGSESNDQDACAWISEAGNRTCPVGLVLVGTTTGFADSTAIIAEPRALFAGDDGVVNLLEDYGRRWSSTNRHLI
jgi:hypothetical protein